MEVKAKWDYHVTPVRKNITKKTRNECWCGCGRKVTLVDSWSRSKSAQSLWKRIWRFLRKLKIVPLHDPAIPPPGIYLNKMKTPLQNHICTAKFAAVLFTIAKIWTQPKCPPVAKWIKMLFIYNTYTQWNTILPLKMKSYNVQQNVQTLKALC